MSATVTTVTAAAAAAMNPWMGVAGSFANGLGQAIAGGQPGYAAGRNESPLDSSGWVVNFGEGSIDAAYDKTNSQAGAFDQYLPYAVLFVGAMIVWRMTKKSA